MSPLVGPSTDPNRTESKGLSDNCGKNNGDISDGVGGEKLVTEKKLVTEEELMTKEKLVTEKKLETEEKIETEDLEGPK